MAGRLKHPALTMIGQMLLVAAIFLTTGQFLYSWYRYYSFIPVTLYQYHLPANTPTLRVFFVGNSYTFFSDLPDMLSMVAASDRAHPVNIQTDNFTVGGKTLEQLFEMPSAQEALRAQSWDYVILQDMSVLPSDPVWTLEMHQGIRNWNMLVRSLGSHTVLFETWARKPGSDWYDNGKHPDLDLINPEVMQDKIDKAYTASSTEIDAKLVRVGDYWAKCRDQASVPDLYHVDGTHPSGAGAYLTAMVFYNSLTGHSIEDVTFVPVGMSSTEADALKQCASEAL